jgi:hypothetical protein
MPWLQKFAQLPTGPTIAPEIAPTPTAEPNFLVLSVIEHPS